MSDSSLGGGPNARRFSQFIRRQLKLPYSDLSLTDKSDLPMALDDRFGLVLALNYGIGPNEPRLLTTDDAGRLLVTGAPGAPEFEAITDDPGQSGAIARVVTPADGFATVPGLAVVAEPLLFGGTNYSRGGSGRAQIIGAKTGFNAAAFVPAGEFSLNSAPASGAQATATQAAGGAGVRHIARRVSFGFSSGAALAGASTVVFNLRDGATGAGTILKSWVYDLPAAVIAPFSHSLELSDVGTAATAMTIETAAGVAGLRVFVNLGGYEAT